jgi:Sulfotransferase family
VVGSPRSGTTLLFDVLDRSPNVASLGTESHLLWEMYHPADSRDWRSHEVRPEDIRARERRTLDWAIFEIARQRRYVDKSPRNSVRVRYLHELFPDARFVYLRRDGRAVVSSLITGWRSTGARFPARELSAPVSIQGYNGSGWKFLAPPGWQEMTSGRTLAEVCAFQWVAANRSILDARPSIDPESWTDVRYEDVVADPVAQIRRLFEVLDLPVDEPVLRFAGSLSSRVSKVAVDAPRPDKWRDEHPEEVAEVLPLLAPMQELLGYPTGMA